MLRWKNDSAKWHLMWAELFLIFTSRFYRFNRGRNLGPRENYLPSITECSARKLVFLLMVKDCAVHEIGEMKM